MRFLIPIEVYEDCEADEIELEKDRRVGKESHIMLLTKDDNKLIAKNENESIYQHDHIESLDPIVIPPDSQHIKSNDDDA